MSRQLFLHHYFPALYFAILLFCAVFDVLTANLRGRIRLQIAAVLLIIAIWNYAHFRSITYGLPWTKGECAKSKWLKSWDFACNDLLDDVGLRLLCTRAAELIVAASIPDTMVQSSSLRLSKHLLRR